MKTAALVFAVAVGGITVPACGKTHTTPTVHWYTDLDEALLTATRQQKPVAVFFGASWDTAWKEIEHRTIPHPAVTSRLARDFVAVYVDTTDDEDKATQEAARRFRIVGDPTIVLLAADATTEVVRFNEYIRPSTMVRALDMAKSARRSTLME